MNRIITYITAIAALSAALASCSREPFDLEGGVRPVVEAKPGDLAFNAFLSAGPATRSDYDTYKLEVPSTGETITLEGFRLPMSAGSMSSVSPETRGLPVDEMYSSFAFSALPYEGKEAVRNSQGIYTVEGLRYSDFEDVAQFVCWAPKAAEGVTYDPASRTLRYDAPTDIPTQPDLVVANPATARPDREEPVVLTFYHALAGVAFQTSSLDDELMTIFPDCTVTSLVLKGVYASGVFDPMTKTWTVDESSKTDLPLLQSNVSATSGSTLTGGEYTALLVPQELPSGAELELKLSYQGKTFTYTYPMGGTALEMSTIYTFALNGRSFFLFEGTGVPGETFKFKVLTPGNSNTEGSATVVTLATVTVGDDGRFSVLLPDDYARAGNTMTFGYAGDAFSGLVAAENRNTVLETVTKLPDWIRCRTNLRSLFMGCTKLRRVDADLSWTSTVTNMAQLFASCVSLEEMPNLNTSNATNTTYMFGNCSQLTEGIPMDLGKCTDAHGMYFNCTNLESVPNINTVKNLNFYYMFKNCYKLTHIEGIETGAATRFTSMFEDCRTLETIPYMDTSKGTNFDAMFQNCYKLKNYETLDTKNGTGFDHMFTNCDAFETKDDIKLTDVSKGTSFFSMFSYCDNLRSFPDDWDFSNATRVEALLRNCPKLETFPSYSFPKATRMADMFAGDGMLQQVGAMDTPVVNQMQRMFMDCYRLEASPLRNTGTAQNMSNVFNSASTQVSGGLQWYPIDMSNATTTQGFIFGCNVKEIPYLNTEKVQTPHYTTGGKNHIFSSYLVTIGGMNMSAVTVDDLWLSSNNLTNLGPLDGLKMNLTLNCPNLTHDSAVTVINSLGEVSGKTLKFHTNVYSTLTADEIEIATAKGWTVSAY